jgi:glycosyltransferase involved in cell wall biosynthesis
LVHGNEAKSLLIQEFPSSAKKCVTIPHGNWIGRYPPGPNRGMSRDSLDIGPEVEFVYLLFGQCQPYKNILTLIRAFKETAKANDRLIIAGRFSTEQYYKDSLLESENDPRILIHNRFIPDEVVSVYFNASDIMCIPYSEILTSGSGMLALSYGLPVLSIKKGYLKDLIPDYCGILMKNTNFEDVCSALVNCKSRKWDSDKIKSYAQQFEFYDAASIYLEALSRQKETSP